MHIFETMPTGSWMDPPTRTKERILPKCQLLPKEKWRTFHSFENYLHGRNSLMNISHKNSIRIQLLLHTKVRNYPQLYMFCTKLHCIEMVNGMEPHSRLCIHLNQYFV